MATVIRNGRGATRTRGLPESVERMLPEKIVRELSLMGADSQCIEELRIRCGRRCALRTREGTLPLRSLITREEMDELFLALCNGSIYAYRDSIAKGFLTLGGGIRVGVCGRAALEGERIVGVYDVDGLNFRFPAGVLPVGEPICRLLRERTGGVLVYAPPAQGKTTLLRSVAAKMAGGRDAWRVAVVDSRGELAAGLSDPSLSLDVLTGYPRGLGIEIALRTMNPELIVCDEIGGEAEAESILRAQHAGVPFLASAHGEHPLGLLRRPWMGEMHRETVFSTYAGIRRRVGGGDYIYDLWTWEEADGLLEERGSDPCFAERALPWGDAQPIGRSEAFAE